MCNGKNNQFDSKIQEMPSVMADYSSSFSSAGLGGGGGLECSFSCLKQCRIINALEAFIWYVQIEQLNVWHFDGYACWEFLQLGECYMTQVRKIKNYYKA